MAAARRISWAWLAVLVALSGCGGILPLATPGSPPTLDPTTPTTMSSAFLKAVLLSPVDIRGSAVAPDGDEDTPGQDAAASVECLGDSGADQTDPNEVIGPDLVVGEGQIQRTYGSMATQGPPEELASGVAEIGSPAGTACLLEVIKTVFRADDGEVRIDPSGLRASSAPVAVGEGGVLVTMSGNLRARGMTIAMSMELLVFHKGRALVMVMAFAAPGSPFPVRLTELAQKIEARLL